MFKSIYKIVFSRFFSLAIFLSIQFLWLFYFAHLLDNAGPYITMAMEFVALFVAILIVGEKMDAGFKITWIILILAFPIFGISIYLLFGNSKKVDFKIRKYRRIQNKTKYQYQEPMIYSMEKLSNPLLKKQASYLNNVGYTMYQNTLTDYYPLGEDFKNALVAELKKANKFIFLEYYIIKEGSFWNDILDVLIEKANSGVEVRVMYDDFGCGISLKRNYAKELRKHNIKVVVFNKLKPFVSVKLQNRDHRKICIVDGNVGFVGGINIGDEYINEEKRFGHWKDTAVRLYGSAVWSFTVMFIQNWNLHAKEPMNYDAYRVSPYVKESIFSNEYVIPYGDSPLDDEEVGRNVYINMISSANNYVYLTTPYLILDNHTRDTLIMASKNGVDVRIITPGIYDKKIISLITKDNYIPLLKAGIKIYEYTPGFIHAKTMVCDDYGCSVGTVNLDYRSFYHHFECGVTIMNSYTVSKVKNDFIDTMKKSQEISIDSAKQNVFKKFIILILRLLAPLL